MTDIPVSLRAAAPATLLTFELWSNGPEFASRFATAFGGPPPAPGRSQTFGYARVLWTEPGVWIAVTAQDLAAGLAARLEDVLADDGALTEVTGAYARLDITGPAWRELLTIGGVFDVENPAFGVGCTAGTVLDHAPVRLDVIAPDQVIAYAPPSYAAGLWAFWREAAARLAHRDGMVA